MKCNVDISHEETDIYNTVNMNNFELSMISDYTPS